MRRNESMEEIRVALQICRDGVEPPTYVRPGDAGMDVRAAVDLVIEPGATVVVPTGLRFAIPDGFEIQVRPRSGLSLHTPLRVPNSPGTIDAGYRDELGILLTNTSPPHSCGEDGREGEAPLHDLDVRGSPPGRYRIRRGDRIAQIVLARVPRISFDRVDSVEGIGQDRGGGFGSTGL
jgi:dUTP pyrophosphatase